MWDVIFAAGVLLFVMFFAPLFVFVVVKMGTYGFLVARHRFSQQLEREEDESQGQGKA